MKPFFDKAMATLEFLLNEQTLDPIYRRVSQVYREMTLENTMKLLIRCKLAFQSRTMLLKMFALFQTYDACSKEIKNLIKKTDSCFVESAEHLECLRDLTEQSSETVMGIVRQWETMRQSSHR